MADFAELECFLASRNVPGIEEYQDSFDSVFTKIEDNLNKLDYWNDDMEQYFSIMIPSHLRRNIFCRFKVELLPSLRDEILLLCPLLDSSNLHNNNLVSSLQIPLKSMVKIDEITFELVHRLTPLWEVVLKTSKAVVLGIPQLVSDEYSYGIPETFGSTFWKSFRRNLRLTIAMLKRTIGMPSKHFDSFQDVLRNNISTNDVEDGTVPSHQSRSIEDSLPSKLTSHINTFIEDLDRSDFQLYKRDLWPIVVTSQSRGLMIFCNMEQRIKLAQDPTGTNVLLIELLRASVPIIKLIRLFFNKLCKITNSPLHPASHMDEALLGKFFKATIEFNRVTIKWLTGLRFITQRPSEPQEWQCNLHTELQNMRTNMFERMMVILAEFFSSPSYLHQVEVQNAQNWCRTWAGQFDVTVKQFLKRYTNFHQHVFP